MYRTLTLGGTTPDPGTITNLSINGAGKYQAGQTGATPNANGLVTLEYINTPGQFFVINDIGGPGFGYGDRQCFGLVRETLYDATDLSSGLPGVFAGGNNGGWSILAPSGITPDLHLTAIHTSGQPMQYTSTNSRGCWQWPNRSFWSTSKSKTLVGFVP